MQLKLVLVLKKIYYCIILNVILLFIVALQPKMVNTCVVVGCNYGYDKYSGISVHRFPVEENRKALWILALKRENWKPSCHSSVCGKHFQTGI